ncbi:MAG TPA: O-antigen ligase family protein [Solirubrobacterales bacterium]|nr:O-antigen ligase family protein [Solirubrobacterales bacterium]
MVLLGTLLLVSTWWDGAYDLRYWGPLAFFATAMLLALVAAGAYRLPRSLPLRISIAAIWAFVAFAGLSALWSESPAGAWEGAARMVLTAAAFTLALAAGARDGGRARIGSLLLVGIAAIALVDLARMFADGSELFLAGRLNLPLGYRNGAAALFAFALWPFLGVAARRGFPSGLRAGAFAAATLMLGLAFLTQSRGVLLGVAAGGLVSIAIGPDRLRRLWLLIAAVAGVAIASGALLAPFDAFADGTGTVVDSDVRSAAYGLLALTSCAFLGGLLFSVLDNGLRAELLRRVRAREVATAALALLVVVGATVTLVKVGNPISYANDKVDEFTDLSASTTSSSGVRLGTVSGQRYDLYRIAWDQFLDRPLVGAGEGSYRFAYYEERRTDRNLDNPHSLPLALLSETGLLGASLFAVWLVAAGLAVARGVRRSSSGQRTWIAGLAAAAATVLAQSAVDWLWLLPGLFALAALTLGLAAGESESEAVEEPVAAEGPGRFSAGRLAVAGGLCLVLLAIALPFLSDLYVRKARVEAATSPQAALDSARTAESLNPLSVTPLYLQASALETQADRQGAREALREALRREPGNFVTLGLLGDLETRAGRAGRARLYYRQALRLNPLDIGLQELSELGKEQDAG